MLLTAALAYARHGIPVLPVHSPAADGGCSCGRAECDRPGKHPRLRRGLTDASTDPRRIEMWWSRWPDANVGLRTGVVMDVADVDSAEGRHGLWHLLGCAPSGPAVRTGGGGWHFWFRPTGYGNRVRLLPGLDWRGAGGYVVAPPSRHASGSAYTWFRRPGDPLPGSPPVLRELIVGPAIFHDDQPIAPPDRYAAAAPEHDGRRIGRPDRYATAAPEHDGRRIGRPDRYATATPEHDGRRIGRPDRYAAAAPEHDDRPIVRPDRYAAAAMEAETNRVARAPVGTRNDTLNRAAFALGRLAGAGLLDACQVAYQLAAAARHAGLGRAEVRRTIRSGLTAGQRQPLDRMRSMGARVA